MSTIIEQIFMDGLNSSHVSKYGENSLMDFIMTYDKFTMDTKCASIMKLCMLVIQTPTEFLSQNEYMIESVPNYKNLINIESLLHALVEQIFVDGLNSSHLLKYGKNNLLSSLMTYNKFTKDTKYISIKKICAMTLYSSPEFLSQNKNYSYLQMNTLLEDIFLENLEKIKLNTNDLIIMVIKYENFTVNTKILILNKLFSNISDKNFGNCVLTNPLIMLCFKSKLDREEVLILIKFLVEKIQVDINKFSTYGTTAVMYAYQTKQMDIVEYLVSKGAILKYVANSGKVSDIMTYNLSEKDRERLLHILVNVHSNKSDFDKFPFE